MKEIDDTETPHIDSLVDLLDQICDLEDKIVALDLRVANLETQRTPADANMDDPEWH